jgi:hypothetical protein
MKKDSKIEVKLPAGIKVSDLKYPDYQKDPMVDEFELWHSARFGWCIPTLMIRGAGRRQAASTDRRSYAIAVDTSQLCSIGLGPHITKTVTVFISKSRQDALQKFLDLRLQGLESAESIRDRISTRRSNTILRRAGLGSMW